MATDPRPAAPRRLRPRPLRRRTSRLFLTEKVRDAIARDAKEPAGHVLNRHQQAIGFYQFVKDLLHDVLGVGGVGYTPADEIAQPGSFLRDDFGDLTVLLGHPRDPRRLIHPLL